MEIYCNLLEIILFEFKQLILKVILIHFICFFNTLVIQYNRILINHYFYIFHNHYYLICHFYHTYHINWHLCFWWYFNLVILTKYSSIFYLLNIRILFFNRFNLLKNNLNFYFLKYLKIIHLNIYRHLFLIDNHFNPSNCLLKVL